MEGLEINEEPYLEVTKSGYELVHSSILNKGMAFTASEREVFHLHGLIPPHVATLEEQQTRSYQAFKRKSSDLEKYIYLRDLQDSNETLFYNLLCECIDEMMPVVYTPIVGLGCQKFSQIYRRPRGLFISYPLKDQIDQILADANFDPVEVIVVSDGERILGLGDQGAGGMGIPIGKLAIYSACAGIHPKATLPILLDVGTDNPKLIADPLYVGWKHERIRGKEYDDFIDLFVKAIKKRFPKVLLQWEDFAKSNATRILNRYRDQLCTFNDDVQGTASVVLGTFLAAIKSSEIPLEKHRIVVAGAGGAGCGISKLILETLIESGEQENEALKNLFLVDRSGLLTTKSTKVLPFQERFRHPFEEVKKWDVSDHNSISLMDVVTHAQATVLIGVTGQSGLFTQEIVSQMASNCPRPIIFPLSNPTSCAEAHPQDIMVWSQNKALVGTGSPFGKIKRGTHIFKVDQTNNAYIFPGIGLGAIAVGASRITDSMFAKASVALAELSPALKDPQENLLPPLEDSRKIAIKIAMAVAQEAIDCKLAKPMDAATLKACILKRMWYPTYLPYKKMDS